MSGLRKSVARGENVGWVSRKDSNTMDRVVAGVTSIYFPRCSPESRSPRTLRRTFFFSPQLTMVYLKKHQRASFSWGSLVAQMVKNLSFIPGLGRSPGEGKGNPLQYSSLKNPMGREAWWSTVHEVAKSQTGLSD